MSSIIKSPFVSFSEQKKTIEIVSSKDAKIINTYVDKKNEVVGRDSEEQEVCEALSDEEIEQEKLKKIFLESHQEYLEKTYDEMILKANKEAQDIIEKAKEEALQLEHEAIIKGRKEGLKSGKEEAMQQVAQLRQELEEEIKAIEEEKKAFYKNVEPKMANVIRTLVNNMVGIQKFDKDTILFVIRKGLEEIDVQGDVIIKVSTQDFDQVMQKKAFLEENLSSQIHLEILKESKLKKNDCTIETNLGNINCSLDERMNGLLKQLSLIEMSSTSR